MKLIIKDYDLIAVNQVIIIPFFFYFFLIGIGFKYNSFSLFQYVIVSLAFFIQFLLFYQKAEVKK